MCSKLSQSVAPWKKTSFIGAFFLFLKKTVRLGGQFLLYLFLFYYWVRFSPNVIVSGVGLSIFGLGQVLNGKSSGI